jgi:hypothetical protein
VSCAKLNAMTRSQAFVNTIREKVALAVMVVT